MTEQTTGVRFARSGDAGAIALLYREAFEINYPDSDWSVVEERCGKRIAKVCSEPPDAQVCMVAQADDGRVVGYIWWMHRTAPDGANEARIIGIGVFEATRKSGVGALLAKALLAYVGRIRFAGEPYRVTAEVSPTNTAVLALIGKFLGTQQLIVFARDLPAVEGW